MKVLGIGAGGHAKVMIESLYSIGDHELVGLLDLDPDLWGSQILGVLVLGNDDLLFELRSQGLSHAFIGVGSIGNTRPRTTLYEKATASGFQMIQTVHPSALVSPSAQLGVGISVMAAAVINASAKLGDNVVVNTGAIVEHDCEIGDHVFIATGATLSATVHVDTGAHIGAGATIRQSITIGAGSLVAAGAVVVSDVPANIRVAGVPARPMKD